jgi:hypothetical protein
MGGFLLVLAERSRVVTQYAVRYRLRDGTRTYSVTDTYDTPQAALRKRSSLFRDRMEISHAWAEKLAPDGRIESRCGAVLTRRFPT